MIIDRVSKLDNILRGVIPIAYIRLMGGELPSITQPDVSNRLDTFGCVIDGNSLPIGQHVSGLKHYS